MNNHPRITTHHFRGRRPAEPISIQSTLHDTRAGRNRFKPNPWPALRPWISLLATLTASQAAIVCTYSLSPTSRTHGYGTATNSVRVTVSSSACAWTVVNSNAWITITSATNGVGDGTVSYVVAANPNPVPRTGVVVIAQQAFTVQQQGVVCAYSLSPTNRVHGYGAASNVVNLTTSSGCSWAVVNTNEWITITSASSGVGPGTVSYAVAANPSASDRLGTVMFADQTFSVTQRGIPCSVDLSPDSRLHGYGATTGTVSVSTAIGCTWTVSNTNDWVTILSASSGSGNGSVSYSLAANPNPTDRQGVVLIGGQPFALTQRAIPCTFDISPSNRTHGYGSTTGMVSVTTRSGCSWTLVNTNEWITILAGASGSGSGTVTYMVDANPNPLERTGVVLIADQILTLKQRAVVCTYDISPTNRVHGFGAATGTVIVATSSGCSWTVVQTNSWITILSSVSGSGFGSVGYAVAFNHSTNERSGTIQIADQVLTLTQRGWTGSGVFLESLTPLDGGQVKLRLLSPTSSTCELQGSSDLINWTPILSLTNTTGVVEYIDIVPLQSDRRFYRARLY